MGRNDKKSTGSENKADGDAASSSGEGATPDTPEQEKQQQQQTHPPHSFLERIPSLEPTVAMAVMGGFFGFLLIPVAFAYIVTTQLVAAIFPVVMFKYENDDNVNITTVANIILWCTVWLPLGVMYVVLILIWDDTHYKRLKHSGPPRPRYFLETAAYAFADSIWQYYESVECIKWSASNRNFQLESTATKQYIFGVHPHGIHCIPLGQFTAQHGVFDKTFPGLYGPKLTGIAATVIFKIPVVRELFFHMGYIDASRSVCHEALQEGQSLFICVGGEEESMYTEQGQDIVVLQKRKGFVRLALSHGASLVPVFGVGNTDTYTTYKFLLKQRLWLQKKAGIALPLFHGRWCSTLPYPVPIKLLVGEPIETPTPKVVGEKPDEALVNKYHAKYVAALKEMHAAHVKDRTLIVR